MNPLRTSLTVAGAHGRATCGNTRGLQSHTDEKHPLLRSVPFRQASATRGAAGQPS